MPRLRRSTRACLLIALVAACAPAGQSQGPTAGVSTTPTAVATPTTLPTLTPRSTAAPAPSGLLLLPTGFAAALEPGTYWSAPPFDIGFAFTVPEPGWVAGHLNPEFVDIQQFDEPPAEGVTPERIVGFAHPLEIHGETIADAAALTPTEAVDLWVLRTDIEATEVAELELLGGAAVRVDVHAPISMLPLFGGEDGTFRLDAAFDVRIAVIAVDGGLFLATVHAPAADLEAAWEDALPILESIDLGSAAR